MKRFELIPFASDRALAQAAAGAWLDEVESAKRRGAAHLVAFSGGRIARSFFGCAAELARAARTSLNAVHFFWADERCVPPDDLESNFRLARELLFDPLQMVHDRIHRIHGEEPADSAAVEAEVALRQIAPLNADGQPMLDLILLGMGEDGHVASLFPGEPESELASPAVYRPVTAAKPPPRRVTLGYAAIAAARQVWVLVSGTGKEAALRASLSTSGRTPLARVLRSRPQTRIYTDVAAR